jgi:predicted secreted hydrolase
MTPAASHRKKRVASLALVAIASAGALAALAFFAAPDLRRTATPVGQARDVPALSPTGLLSAGDTAGFARATVPRPFTFPADHGPHPEFRTEWWYFTGVLTARGANQGNRRFGYQLTIFRQALAPNAPARDSAWAARDVYMAHLAVTDVQGRRFAAFERIARGGLALAGAQAEPFRVWVEGWQMRGPETGGDIFPLTLHARATAEKTAPREVEIALDLRGGRGPLLQGDRGLSAKGPEAGNASYYYSMTRIGTSGAITLDGERFEVRGSSWLDREWSTSALGPDLTGWDWLSLQLIDGRDLMLFRLRRRDGTAAPESRATLIESDGKTRVFGADAFGFVPEKDWRSPHTGARYPVRARVTIPDAKVDLLVNPLLVDQELRLSVRYWEGAVVAKGTGPDGTFLAGTGYLELTGYSGPSGADTVAGGP